MPKNLQVKVENNKYIITSPDGTVAITGSSELFPGFEVRVIRPDNSEHTYRYTGHPNIADTIRAIETK
jgi:hypothetical protein